MLFLGGHAPVQSAALDPLIKSNQGQQVLLPRLARTSPNGEASSSSSASAVSQSWHQLPACAPLLATTSACAALLVADWRWRRRRRRSRSMGSLLAASSAHGFATEMRATDAESALAPESEVAEDASSNRALCLGACDGGLLRCAEGLLRKSLKQRGDDDVSVTATFLNTGIQQDFIFRKRAELVAMLRFIKDGTVDFVAYPVKDIPVSLPDGVLLAAVLPRGDAREALLLRTGTPAWKAAASASAERSAREGTESCLVSLADLPEGSVICASAPRRRLQVEAKHRHLVVEKQRTAFVRRLRRLNDGAFDGLLLSSEGLQRLGFTKGGSEGFWILDEDEVMPALGQGAIGLLCCEDDEGIIEFLAELDDSASHACVEVERTLARMSAKTGIEEVAMGGKAELLADEEGGGKQKLRLRCSAAFAGPDGSAEVVSVERVGDPASLAELTHGSAAEPLVEQVREELLRRLTAKSLLSASSSSSAPVTSAQAETATLGEDDDEGGDLNAAVERDACQDSIFGAEMRMSVEAVDCDGTTQYKGRVCTVLARRDGEYAGAIIDIDCEVPTRYYPERSPSGREQRLKLGDEVDVYCCWRQQGSLRVVLEPPPRLPRRGAVGRTTLADLRPGSGPFKAIVISCTAAGTLVDFNCEVPGYLMSSKALARGDEIRVYCYEVDAVRELCQVGTQQLPKHRQSSASLRVQDLEVCGTAHKGQVKSITSSGALVDFKCEVLGKMDARDIDIGNLQGDLTEGQEVTVFVTAVNKATNKVQISMFRPRPSTIRPTPRRRVVGGSPPPPGPPPPGPPPPGPPPPRRGRNTRTP